MDTKGPYPLLFLITREKYKNCRCQWNNLATGAYPRGGGSGLRLCKKTKHFNGPGGVPSTNLLSQRSQRRYYILCPCKGVKKLMCVIYGDHGLRVCKKTKHFNGPGGVPSTNLLSQRSQRRYYILCPCKGVNKLMCVIYGDHGQDISPLVFRYINMTGCPGRW